MASPNPLFAISIPHQINAKLPDGIALRVFLIDSMHMPAHQGAYVACSPFLKKTNHAD
jgi:hypothetical protein